MSEIFDAGSLGQWIRRLTPEERTLRLAAFYGILNGRALSVDELSLRLGFAVDRVQGYITDMVSRGLLVIDEQETVVGSHGLSLIPTNHRLHVEGRNLFTWCAADAVGIPAALGANAKIISRCIQCNGHIEIVMNKGEIQYSSQEDVCIWVVEADLGQSIVGST
ncbi:MAG TPA: organomercurial lyase [Syntrophales bacterium]|nr:organomercurial lyase [Syntrophales bacterium]